MCCFFYGVGEVSSSGLLILCSDVRGSTGGNGQSGRLESHSIWKFEVTLIPAEVQFALIELADVEWNEILAKCYNTGLS